MNPTSLPKKSLSAFALTMMAVVSVDSLRNLPIGAQYGATLVSFYLIAAVCFFLPLAIVASKLTTHYPNTGGSYVWIEKAFGTSFGQLSILLQWLYNMIWYPTIFTFISSIVAYLLFPSLAQNKFFILSCSLLSFWLLTFIHCRGIHASAILSTFGAIVGTLIPMGLITLLAILWLGSGHVSASPLDWSAFIPNQHTLNNLGFFSNILFSLLGLEVIAMHAGNVTNPRKTYPKAFLMSACLILVTITLSSLALCIIMPYEKIALINGVIDVFDAFFAAYHLPYATLIIGACIGIGGLAIAASWMVGLARGLHTAACQTNAPRWFKHTNQRDVPTHLLITQAVIYTFLLGAFLIFPDINSSYWILSALTAQFALLYYILLFAAAIRLLRAQPKHLVNRTVTVILPSIAALTCGAGIIVGFLPPETILPSHAFLYEACMITCFATVVVIPIIITLRRKAITPRETVTSQSY